MLEAYKDTKFIKERIAYYQGKIQEVKQAYTDGEGITDPKGFSQRLDFILLDVLEDSLDLALAYDSTQMESSREKITFFSKTLDGMRYSLRLWTDKLLKNY
jgi:hypothetical protein